MSLMYLRVPQEYKVESQVVPKRKLKSSKGEIFLAGILKKLGFNFLKEFSIESLKKLRFDFLLVGQKILIEWDGETHFKFCKYIHKTEKKFLRARERDILKTQEAVGAGYLLIRIDYNYLDQTELVINFISQSIANWKQEGQLVTLNPTLYDYLSEDVNTKLIKKYKNN